MNETLIRFGVRVKKVRCETFFFLLFCRITEIWIVNNDALADCVASRVIILNSLFNERLIPRLSSKPSS